MEEFNESNDLEPQDSPGDNLVDTSDITEFDDTFEDSSEDNESCDDDLEDSYDEDISDSEDDSGQDLTNEEPDVEDEDYNEEGDVVDESELSPSELYERGQQEAKDMQDEAEQWADDEGMDTWSDGSPRTNYDGDIEDLSDVNSSTEEDAITDFDSEGREALEEDVKAKGDALNQEYMDLMDRKQGAFDNAVDSTNVEDRDRFAEEQHRIGEQMEQVRSRIIENNNRLK